MSYFNKKKNKKVYSWIIIVVLFCLCLFLIKNVFNLYLGERKSRLNKIESEFILNELDEKNNQILSEIEYLKTEKGIETELRDKFRVVKKGEQMAVIVNSKDKDNKSGVGLNISLWEKIKNFLKLD